MFELADYEMAREKVWAISDLPPRESPASITPHSGPGFGLRSNLEITAGL